MRESAVYEWYVVMYRREKNVEEHRLGPFASEEIADKVDAQVNGRLDGRFFYTRIVKKERTR